jgi:CDP-glucose 4,6-dehydratase
VRHSYQHPVETYEINVMGTVNILEAIRQTQTVQAALIITSDKCYKNDDRIRGYLESDAMGGHDPYSSSKGCAELITAAYCKSFFAKKQSSDSTIHIGSARAGNVIGGGDWSADRLIPDIIRATIDEKPLIIRNPNAVRPWQHVLEPLNGYLGLIENLWEHGLQFEGGWNFGPIDDNCKPVGWILKVINKLWDGGIQWEMDTADNPHEDSFLKVDSTKARKLLGWSTKLSLREALAWVMEWYQGYMKKQNMRRLSEEQIQRYEELNQQ